MRRLTNKDEFGNYDINGVESTVIYSDLKFNEVNRMTDALNKLGRLEDLEENIGISMLDLFNDILGKEIYDISEYGVYDNWKIIKMRINLIFENGKSLGELKNGELENCVKIIEFNKTWFLTEEEAKKKIKDKIYGGNYEI